MPKMKRPGSPILFFLCMSAILITGYLNDHNSCVRSNSLVDELNRALVVNFHAPPVFKDRLKCGFPFPQVEPDSLAKFRNSTAHPPKR